MLMLLMLMLNTVVVWNTPCADVAVTLFLLFGTLVLAFVLASLLLGIHRCQHALSNRVPLKIPLVLVLERPAQPLPQVYWHLLGQRPRLHQAICFFQLLAVLVELLDEVAAEVVPFQCN